MIEPLEKATHAIDTNADLHSVLVDSLNQRWRTYTEELIRCQTKCSEKAVHHLRVAIRRLISTLDLIMTIHLDARLRAVRRQLMKRLKLLSELRDVQVQVLDVRKMRKTFPELGTFLTVLMLRERRILNQIDKKLRRVQTRSMEEHAVDWNKQLDILLSSSATRSAGMAAVAGAAGAAFTRCVGLLQNVDANDAKSIHKLRVTFKKFRYAVEALQGLLVGVTDKKLKEMQAYQRKLGEIQDIEVLTKSVNAFARGRKAMERDLERVHQELARRHAELISTFMNSANDLFTFWDHKPVHLRLHSGTRPSS